MTVIVDIKDIIALVLFGCGAALFVVAFVVDRIVCAVKKRQQRRIDEAYKDGEL